MDQCDIEKRVLKQQLNCGYYCDLDLDGFYQMLKDPSYCYKFYWLEALVILISEGKTETTFDEVIDEMICSAWYSVCEFHIHLSGMVLGKARDGLERAVLKLSELSGLESNASGIQIKNAIREYNVLIRNEKRQLTNNVPYRALAGFFDSCTQTPEWKSISGMLEYIRKVNDKVVTLPYILGNSSSLDREVYLNPSWCAMIKDHTVSILGWIQEEKLKWLQTNNPELPGLVYKLEPLNEKMRKLGHVRNLWDGISEVQSIRDIFNGKTLLKGQYDVDHFIPWSFVMCDELWNLMPMDSSLNSSKSNYLPRWDSFFKGFAENQYTMYSLVAEYPKLHSLFEKCYRDNLHSLWATQDLYLKGNTHQEFINILEKNMKPVYDSAKRQGYTLWKY